MFNVNKDGEKVIELSKEVSRQHNIKNDACSKLDIDLKNSIYLSYDKYGNNDTTFPYGKRQFNDNVIRRAYK